MLLTTQFVFGQVATFKKQGSYTYDKVKGEYRLFMKPYEDNYLVTIDPKSNQILVRYTWEGNQVYDVFSYKKKVLLQNNITQYSAYNIATNEEVEILIPKKMDYLEIRSDCTQGYCRSLLKYSN